MSKRAGIFRAVQVIIFLYVFLVSISLMSHAFKGFGKPFAQELITTTSNPLVGLLIGILATSLMQSSSTTTSMVVAFVAAGTLTIRGAIPIVMGANIGTTVTNTLVAMGHITRKEEFKRALSGSTVHDFFNLLTVAILFPLEMSTHYLERVGTSLASLFTTMGGVKCTSPIKVIVKPAVHMVESLIESLTSFGGIGASVTMLVIAIVLLMFSLYNITRVMRALVINRADMVFDRVIKRNAILAMFMGMVFTSIVQSSSITTSILVPLVAAGILEIEQSFPIVLGANMGTTVTAILASFTGNIAGITIAFIHLMFNLTGILIIYPFKRLRNIPIRLARWISTLCYQNRALAIVYVLGIFYAIPLGLIMISKRFP